MSQYHLQNKRIAKNTLFLYMRMFFVLLVNLYISRLLLNILGVTDYGVYMIVGGLVSLFGFFNTTLASTLQRYYNYEGTRNKEKGIQDVFSTGCVINVLIAISMFLLLETVGLWYMNHHLVIPVDRTPVAKVLFHTSALSLVFIILQIPAVGLLLAKEKMGGYAAISVVDIILKLGATVTLTRLDSDPIETYAYLLLGIAVFDCILYYTYAKLSFSYIHLNRKIHKDTALSLLSFTGWNLLGTLAFMLRGQGISLLLNNFFGPIVNAARGIAMQASSAIGYFSSNISFAFAPQISNSVAAEDFHRARNMMFMESKICYSLLLILGIPLCLDIDYILKLWLGENIPVDSNIFTTLMLIDAVICSLNTPCTQITMATGNIKTYEIASTTINLCLIPVCYFFLRMGYHATSSFVITILFSIILQTACLIITHKQFNFEYKSYFLKVLLPCIALTVLLPIIPAIIRLTIPASFVRLLVMCIMVIATGLPLVYFILLDSREKHIAKGFITEVANKVKK